MIEWCDMPGCAGCVPSVSTRIHCPHARTPAASVRTSTRATVALGLVRVSRRALMLAAFALDAIDGVLEKYDAAETGV